MNKSRKGFTLAEVLVTLAIIGVVAALTIPTLIQSTNSSRYQTSLKKAVSILNQALMTSVAQNGVDASSATSATNLAALFKPYLNVLKDDNTGAFWLSDGSKIQFVGPGVACPTISNPAAFAAAAQCYAIVDVNGDKGPNDEATAATASDLYIVGIGPNNVVPVGLTAAAVTLPATFKLNSSGNAVPAADAYPATILASNYGSLAAVTGST